MNLLAVQEHDEQEQQTAAEAQVTGNEGDLDEELDGASLMEQFLSDPSHDYKTLKYGDVMDGVIMRIDRDENVSGLKPRFFRG